MMRKLSFQKLRKIFYSKARNNLIAKAEQIDAKSCARGHALKSIFSLVFSFFRTTRLANALAVKNESIFVNCDCVARGPRSLFSRF